MKKRVLVFPCGSEIGLEIYKSLNRSIHFELIGGSSSDDHGKFVYKNYVDGLPFVDTSGFVEEINKIVDEQQIDYIFPAHDSVVLKLAEEANRGSLNCKVITSPYETCQIARSKLATYASLKDIISTPKVYADIDSLGAGDFPLFLKPDVGQGGKGTYTAHNAEDVAFYMQKDPSLMILEYLPGKEYTIDCFTDSDGTLLFCHGRERRRIANGISVNSVSVDDERFLTWAKKINSKLKFSGVWFFQVKERQDGEFVLMEIAPRIAGTMGLVRGLGVNLPLLSLFDAEGSKVTVIPNHYSLEIDRALENRYRHNIEYKHVYIDFDDLVIVDGKTNPQVMAFIHQCINENILLHLITRHAEDIHETLEKYRIGQLFDDIVCIKDGQPKSGYVLEHDAIFIDDSYAERTEVRQSKGIPVFDAHMIESLMR